MTENEKRILMTLYEMNEDLDYSNYEIDEIADFLRLDYDEVKTLCEGLLRQGYLHECMTYDDDGMDTYILSEKALLALGLEV